MKSVSCIIPVYGLTVNDNLFFFRELLSSLSSASKTLKEHFEVIVVNDDRSRIGKELLQSELSHAGLEGCFTYVENEENKGQAYSRNAGAQVATNDYLHFLDQDDYVSADFYHQFVASPGSFDVYITKPFFCLPDTTVVPAYTRLLELYYQIHNSLKGLWFLLASNLVYSPGQAIVSRRAYLNHGGFPVLQHKGSDDYGLFYHMIFRDNLSCHYLNKSIFYYRIHSSQNSRQCDMDKSVLEFLSEVPAKTTREVIIHALKTKKTLRLFNKLVYVLFFKRAKI